jgi:hypothetical protein
LNLIIEAVLFHPAAGDCLVQSLDHANLSTYEIPRQQPAKRSFRPVASGDTKNPLLLGPRIVL